MNLNNKRLAIVVFVLLGSITSTPAFSKKPSTKADPNNVAQVERGEKVYKRFCSLCHGRNLEGQKDWHKPKANGRMPAPPHDATGHTWHHADIVLFNQTKYGIVPPYAPKGYQSDMPAFKDSLKDEDIWAVLAFIKSRWPKENLEFQIKINENYEPW